MSGPRTCSDTTVLNADTTANLNLTCASNIEFLRYAQVHFAGSYNLVLTRTEKSPDPLIQVITIICRIAGTDIFFKLVATIELDVRLIPFILSIDINTTPGAPQPSYVTSGALPNIEITWNFDGDVIYTISFVTPS